LLTKFNAAETDAQEIPPAASSLDNWFRSFIAQYVDESEVWAHKTRMGQSNHKRKFRGLQSKACCTAALARAKRDPATPEVNGDYMRLHELAGFGIQTHAPSSYSSKQLTSSRRPSGSRFDLTFAWGAGPPTMHKSFTSALKQSNSICNRSGKNHQPSELLSRNCAANTAADIY